MKPFFSSKHTLFICFVFMLYVGVIFYPKWEQSGSEATISWDVSGYYNYLPAIFIYNDLKYCNYQFDIKEKYSPAGNNLPANSHKTSKGKIMQYTCGQAILMSPFFILAHSYTKHFQSIHSADGFSYPYQIGLGLGMLGLSLLGLLLLRKILTIYYSDNIVSLCLIFYVFGTAYLNYSSIDQAQANPSLFTLYCLLVYLTIKLYAKPKTYLFASVGLLLGLIVLIRPTEVIALIVPLFWGLNSCSEIPDRFKFFAAHKKSFFLTLMLVFCFPTLQFLYWKYAVNQWFVYSYNDQGFSWLSPHFFDFMFNYNSGALAYSPGFILPFIGLYRFVKKPQNFIAVSSIIAISTYITTSWDIWDYGWYSGRAIVQYLPFFAFPLCSLMNSLFANKVSKYFLFTFIALCIYFNVWWTFHIHAGDVPAMNLNVNEYWQNIGRW